MADAIAKRYTAAAGAPSASVHLRRNASQVFHEMPLRREMETVVVKLPDYQSKVGIAMCIGNQTLFLLGLAHSNVGNKHRRLYHGSRDGAGVGQVSWAMLHRTTQTNRPIIVVAYLLAFPF